MLAPDIVEAILAGSADQGIMVKKLERPLPASWEEQRRKIFPASTTDRPLDRRSLSDRQRLIRPWDQQLEHG